MTTGSIGGGVRRMRSMASPTRTETEALGPAHLSYVRPASRDGYEIERTAPAEALATWMTEEAAVVDADVIAVGD